MDRRRFLQGMAVAGAGLGLGLAGCGSGGDSSTAATVASGGGGGGTRKVKLGFIALTDCASVVMARELGYFADRDLDVTIEKQASWPATRDALLNGQIDGCHGLYTLPLSVATGVGGNGSRDLRVAMMLNNNGQAITLAKDLAAAGYGDPAAAADAIAAKKGASLAMTFPGGTHDLWLRYWLLAGGVDLSSVGIDPVPPPQMVQNMSVGNVAGFCVGEPWNAVAVKQDIGFTAIASQDIWEHHPEKALLVTKRLAEEQPDVTKDLIGAVLQASQWLDDPANRSKAADTLGTEAYVNAPADEIRGRLTGTYDLGAGLGNRTFEGDQMQFFRGGKVNLPRRAHYIWAATQYQRMGYLDQAPDAQALADELILTDLYAEAAQAAGVDVPDDDMAPFEVRLDGVTFDPAHPAEEATRP
ncbi:MAG TPA: CmpA/NrtA family ABC transporter substrate-binding protein [Acidimicrobiales bacterium]|nr:CmpA/NrtA family ABC transporter substrate-binding protein [Acidimicrobiales bacterium]